MLEFYPLPTNLNHGSVLYQNSHHMSSRFLDNHASNSANNNLPNLNSNNCLQLQQQQQQQMQMQQMTAIPHTHAPATSAAVTTPSQDAASIVQHSPKTSLAQMICAVSSTPSASLTLDASASSTTTAAQHLQSTTATIPQVSSAATSATSENASAPHHTHSSQHSASVAAANSNSSASPAAGMATTSKLSGDCSGRTGMLAKISNSSNGPPSCLHCSSMAHTQQSVSALVTFSSSFGFKRRVSNALSNFSLFRLVAADAVS